MKFLKPASLGPMAAYTEPDQIRERLSVLHDKSARIVAYNRSCALGEPNLDLLDEKQRSLVAFRDAFREQVGAPPIQRFPWSIRRTLGLTIWELQQRLAQAQQETAT